MTLLHPHIGRLLSEQGGFRRFRFQFGPTHLTERWFSVREWDTRGAVVDSVGPFCNNSRPPPLRRHSRRPLLHRHWYHLPHRCMMHYCKVVIGEVVGRAMIVHSKVVIVSFVMDQLNIGEAELGHARDVLKF